MDGTSSISFPPQLFTQLLSFVLRPVKIRSQFLFCGPKVFLLKVTKTEYFIGAPEEDESFLTDQLLEQLHCATLFLLARHLQFFVGKVNLVKMLEYLTSSKYWSTSVQAPPTTPTLE